jgi:hypothetical protein
MAPKQPRKPRTTKTASEEIRIVEAMPPDYTPVALAVVDALAKLTPEIMAMTEREHERVRAFELDLLERDREYALERLRIVESGRAADDDNLMEKIQGMLMQYAPMIAAMMAKAAQGQNGQAAAPSDPPAAGGAA